MVLVVAHTNDEVAVLATLNPDLTFVLVFSKLATIYAHLERDVILFHIVLLSVFCLSQIDRTSADTDTSMQIGHKKSKEKFMTPEKFCEAMEAQKEAIIEMRDAARSLLGDMKKSGHDIDKYVRYMPTEPVSSLVAQILVNDTQNKINQANEGGISECMLRAWTEQLNPLLLEAVGTLKATYTHAKAVVKEAQEAGLVVACDCPSCLADREKHKEKLNE
jgi:hypothetical protein